MNKSDYAIPKDNTPPLKSPVEIHCNDNKTTLPYIEKPKNANKSDCCNAEVEQNENYAYYCSECGKYQDMILSKPKTTKYYQVIISIGSNNSKVSGYPVIAENPIEAVKQFQKENGWFTPDSSNHSIFEVKLIEITQEDTTNQEADEQSLKSNNK